MLCSGTHVKNAFVKASTSDQVANVLDAQLVNLEAWPVDGRDGLVLHVVNLPPGGLAIHLAHEDVPHIS